MAKKAVLYGYIIRRVGNFEINLLKDYSPEPLQKVS